MRNEQDRSVVAAQEFLQPGQRGDVQVVGWLVQYHQIGLAQQQPRQAQSRLLPAAEPAHRSRLLHVGQAQAGQNRGGIGLTPATATVKLNQSAIVLGQRLCQLTVAGRGNALGQDGQSHLGRDSLPLRRSQHIADRSAGRKLEGLRQIAQPQAGRSDLHAALVRLELAGDDFEQGALPGAVGADQSGPFAAVECEADSVQHLEIAEPFCYVADLKHVRLLRREEISQRMKQRMRNCGITESLNRLFAEESDSASGPPHSLFHSL